MPNVSNRCKLRSNLLLIIKATYNVVNFLFSTKRQLSGVRAGIPRQIPGVACRDAARKFGFESERGRGVLAALAVAYKLQSKLLIYEPPTIARASQ